MRRRLAVLVPLLACLGAAEARAATITVDVAGDLVASDGRCSLREAATAARTGTASGGGIAGECAAGQASDAIVVPAGTYELTRPDGALQPGGGVSLTGAGAATTVVRQTVEDGVVALTGSAEVAGLTITGGDAKDGADLDQPFDTGVSGDGGAGILLDAATPGATLVVRDCVIADNHAGDGQDGVSKTGAPGTGSGSGGFATGSSAGSGGSGGGISVGDGSLVLERTVVRGNSAGDGGDGGSATGGPGGPLGGMGGVATGGDGGYGGLGGGVVVFGGTLTMQDVVLEDNRSGDAGAGGAAAGGTGGSDLKTPAGNGGAAYGGKAGQAGGGGGAYAGEGSGERVLVRGNVAGAGAPGGAAVGGAGASGAPGVDGGNGGQAVGGDGGGSGNGAGLLLFTIALRSATLTGNALSSGGTGGAATGGAGGTGGEETQIVGPGDGGDGGAASGGLSAYGGTGGAVFGGGDDAQQGLTHVTVTGNTEAPGAPAAVATGGKAGNRGKGLGTAQPGTPGTSFTWEARPPATGAIAGFIGLAVRRSVVADTGSVACSGTIADGGANVVSGTAATCPGTVAQGPLLLPLADDGGLSATHALASGSAALGAVPAVSCSGTDQRGVARGGGPSDAGAFEAVAPGATTGVVSDLSATGATVAGTAAPGGRGTFRVELGTTTAYGAATPETPVTSLGGVPVTAALGGLAPGTTYHYRLVVTTAYGTATGADATFTTPAAPPPGAGGTTTTPGTGGTGGTPTARPPRVGATIRVTSRLVRGTTRLTRIAVAGLRARDRVVVTCSGRGCPRGTRRVTTTATRAGTRVVGAKLAKAGLRPGAVVTVTVTRAGHEGRTSRVVVRRGRKPQVTDRCVAPGASTPRACA